MLKVAITTIVCLAFAAGVWVVGEKLAAEQSVDWAASLQSAAKELRIDLTDECMAELRAHIELYGFERGAVTLRGVLIRDRDGVDKWLCAGR